MDFLPPDDELQFESCTTSPTTMWPLNPSKGSCAGPDFTALDVVMEDSFGSCYQSVKVLDKASGRYMVLDRETQGSKQEDLICYPTNVDKCNFEFSFYGRGSFNAHTDGDNVDATITTDHGRESGEFSCEDLCTLPTKSSAIIPGKT